jgi:hypothetical protein
MTRVVGEAGGRCIAWFYQDGVPPILAVNWPWPNRVPKIAFRQSIPLRFKTLNPLIAACIAHRLLPRIDFVPSGMSLEILEEFGRCLGFS